MSLKIGIASYFNPDLAPLRIMELLLQADLTTISIWGADRDGTGPMPQSYKDKLRLARSHFGLTFESMHAPFLLTGDLYGSNESARLKVVDILKQAVADAAELEIPILIVHAHRSIDPDELLPAGQRSFTELLEAVSDQPVRLAVENTYRSIALLEWVLNEFPADKVGLCYDSGHDQLFPAPTFDLLRCWGHRLLTTHIQDNHGQSDDHLPPGEGLIDWQAFARAFPWKTYTGCFMLEPNMTVTAFTDPAEFLRQCRSGAQNILNLAPQSDSS